MRLSRSRRTGPSAVALAVIVTMVLTGLVVWYIARPLKGTVAVVNGRVITKDMLYKQMEKQGGKEALNALVEQTVIMQEAGMRNLKLTDAELKAQSDALIIDQYGSEESFAALLERYGLSRKQVVEDWRSYFTARKIILTDAAITDDAVAAYFQEHKADYDTPESIFVRTMTLETEDAAKEALSRVNAGEDFVEVAKEKSTDTATKDSGGEIGWVHKGDAKLKPGVEAVAFGSEAGAVSNPIETESGWVLVQVTEKKAAVSAVYEEVKDKVRKTVEDAKVNDTYPAWIEALVKKAKVEHR